MKIGSLEIGRGRTFLIAEIGGNHEGDFDEARRMIREAATAGADAVKFQIFGADRLVNRFSSHKAYSGISHTDQWQRFKKMEFSAPQYRELKRLADKSKVVFLASVFDPEWLDRVDMLLPAYKIASGDLTYRSLIAQMKKRGKPMLISTGASSMEEITALTRFVGRKNLALLHCVCAYPAPHDQMNLSTIPYLAKRFRVPIGFSDHSLGIEACLAAVALGAAILEKHFTLDASRTIGDHRHSMTPEGLARLVASVRVIEKTIGRPRTKVFLCEKRAQPLVRRSFYAARDLDPGQHLRAADLLALRPLEGLPVEDEKRWLGRRLTGALKKGQPLLASNLRNR